MLYPFPRYQGTSSQSPVPVKRHRGEPGHTRNGTRRTGRSCLHGKASYANYRHGAGRCSVAGMGGGGRILENPRRCVSPSSDATAVTAPVCPVFRVVVAGRYLVCRRQLTLSQLLCRCLACHPPTLQYHSTEGRIFSKTTDEGFLQVVARVRIPTESVGRSANWGVILRGWVSESS